MSREEKVLLNATACFLSREDEILLGWKTRGIGKNRWNGYGGRVEEGEAVLQTAVRELEEETDGVIVRPEDLEKIAIVHFHNIKSDGSNFVCVVHFYLVHKWKGDVKETEEMINPTWFKKNKLPFVEMMPADEEWLPIALRGKKIIAHAYLGPFQEKSLAPVEIEYVEEF